MRYILAFLLVAFVSFPAQAGPGTDRYSPMGDRTSLFQKELYSNAEKSVIFEYYFLGPKTLEPGVEYPLILMLHGRSGHAYGAYILANEIVKNGMPAFVLVPVMEERISSWFEPHFKKQDKKLTTPLDHVLSLTKSFAATFPIDKSRIYVTGYSMGGAGTFAALKQAPDLFAAGIPICGGWYPKDAKHFVNMPIWAFHGAKDKSVPINQTTDMIGAIQKAGGSPELTIYPAVGHNSWVYAYIEPTIWTWLFSHKKP